MKGNKFIQTSNFKTKALVLKSYHAPQLTNCGNLQDLTRGSGGDQWA